MEIQGRDLRAKLQEMKNKSNLSNQQIADISATPLSTVTKILNGETESPSFYTVCGIVRALGGSVDEMIGIPTDSDSRTQKPTEYEIMLGEKQKEIERLTQSHERELAAVRADKDSELMNVRKSKRILAIWFSVVLSFVILILAVDILNGNIGFIRYASEFRNQSVADGNSVMQYIKEFFSKVL